MTAVLQFKLLTGEAVTLTPMEFLRVTFHRYLLMFYGLIVLFIFVANSAPARDAVPLAVRVFGYTASVSAGLGVFLIAAVLSRWASHRFTGQQVIQFPAVLAVTVAASVVFGEWMGARLYGDPFGPAAQVMIKVAFYVVTVELAANGAMHVLIPRILSDLRKSPPSPAQTFVPLAQMGLDLDRLIRLEASGDQVVVVSDDGLRMMPGPLAALVAQMPDGIGVQVHRSDWVMAGAVTGVTRLGRSRALRLRNGDLVRIASSRDAQIAVWLAQQGHA